MIKHVLPWVLKGGLSLGLVAWVLSKVDLSTAWSRVVDMDGAMVVVAVVLMLIQTALGALRWGLVLRALEAVFRWSSTVAGYYIGVFFAMVLLVCLTEPILMARLPDLPGTWVFPLLLALGVLGILVLASLDKLPVRLHRWRVVRGLVQLAGDTRRLFFHPAWSLATVLMALAGHINLSLAVYVLAVGLGLDVHALDCLVLVPPVVLIVTLPISIAGWGVRETAMVTAFGFVGVPEHSSLALSILFGLVVIVTGLPGGLIWLLSRDRAAAQDLQEREKIEG